MKGIEPSSQPWEGHILPLNHTRDCVDSLLAERERRCNSKFWLKRGLWPFVWFLDDCFPPDMLAETASVNIIL